SCSIASGSWSGLGTLAFASCDPPQPPDKLRRVTANANDRGLAQFIGPWVVLRGRVPLTRVRFSSRESRPSVRIRATAQTSHPFTPSLRFSGRGRQAAKNAKAATGIWGWTFRRAISWSNSPRKSGGVLGGNGPIGQISRIQLLN